MAEGGPDVAAIVNDSRLTPAAVRVILHVAFLGGGPHNVSRTELSILIGGGDKPIRAAIDRAEHCGYLTSAPAGPAGRRLQFVGAVDNSTPFVSTPPRESIADPIDAPEGVDTINRLPRGTRSLAVVVDDAEDDTPIVPAALDEQTERAMEQHAGKLAGCRDSLRDYLRLFVRDPRKRFSFVQLIAGWLDGIDPNVWKMPDGSSLPAAERPAALALALNDLGASTRPMKGPEGDPSNLRTKLNIHLQQRGQKPYPARHPRPARNTAGPQQFEYTPTTEFKGFTR